MARCTWELSFSAHSTLVRQLTNILLTMPAPCAALLMKHRTHTVEIRVPRQPMKLHLCGCVCVGLNSWNQGRSGCVGGAQNRSFSLGRSGSPLVRGKHIANSCFASCQRRMQRSIGRADWRRRLRPAPRPAQENINLRRRWWRKARLWRLVFSQSKDGFWEPCESVAFALNATLRHPKSMRPNMGLKLVQLAAQLYEGEELDFQDFKALKDDEKLGQPPKAREAPWRSAPHR